MPERRERQIDRRAVARVSHHQLRARSAVEGYYSGIHKSPYHGFNVEFAEYREYSPGDDPRYLDWRLYARSDRYYLKKFEDETNLRCHLLVDFSGSMGFKSARAAMTKLEYAQCLAAALAYLMLHQQDAVGVLLFADRPLRYVPARAVRSHLDVVLRTLGALEPQGRTRLGPALHELAERIKRRGLIVLCSDLMDRPAEVLAGLQHFRHNHHEVVVFHILDPDELEFPYTDSATFVDMESGEKLTTEPWEIARRYRERLAAWTAQYRVQCRENRIDYVQLDTRTPFDQALLAYLEKRSRLL